MTAQRLEELPDLWRSAAKGRTDFELGMSNARTLCASELAASLDAHPEPKPVSLDGLVSAFQAACAVFTDVEVAKRFDMSRPSVARWRAGHMPHPLVMGALFREALEHLKALASHPVTGWRPIETAPKDGTEEGGSRYLLCKTASGKAEFYFWDADQYAKKPRPFWNSYGLSMFGVRHIRASQPTHWSPLPGATDPLLGEVESLRAENERIQDLLNALTDTLGIGRDTDLCTVAAQTMGSLRAEVEAARAAQAWEKDAHAVVENELREEVGRLQAAASTPTTGTQEARRAFEFIDELFGYIGSSGECADEFKAILAALDSHDRLQIEIDECEQAIHSLRAELQTMQRANELAQDDTSPVLARRILDQEKEIDELKAQLKGVTVEIAGHVSPIGGAFSVSAEVSLRRELHAAKEARDNMQKTLEKALKREDALRSQVATLEHQRDTARRQVATLEAEVDTLATERLMLKVNRAQLDTLERQARDWKASSDEYAKLCDDLRAQLAATPDLSAIIADLKAWAGLFCPREFEAATSFDRILAALTLTRASQPKGADAESSYQALEDFDVTHPGDALKFAQPKGDK